MDNAEEFCGLPRTTRKLSKILLILPQFSTRDCDILSRARLYVSINCNNIDNH